MSKYKEIKGFKVQTLASDTAASGIPSATWASGGSLPAAINENAGAGATYNAALSFGGQGNPPSPLHPVSGETDSYNGTSWSEVAEINTARRLLAGAGTQTAALAYGGWPPNYANTEEWNGSSWTEVADLNTARRQATGVGVNAEACLMVGGKVTNATDNVESWNGSSWTEIAEINTAREQSNNWGTSTSAVSAGGVNTPGATIASVESWNGSAWTEITDLNVGRRRAGTSGPDNTSGLFFGGDSPAPALVASTEHFDGSAWTEVADLSAAKGMEASAGHDAGSSLAIGGDAPGRVATTEEFVAPSNFTQINLGQVYYNSGSNAFKVTEQPISGGTWASGVNINTSREGGSGAGESTEAALLVGGYTTASPTIRVANTESWNGSAWTEVNDLNSARYLLKSSGTYTAALAYGGNTPPPTVTAVTESWNGSSWTEVNDLNTARQSLGGVGPYTSAIAFGGTTPTKVAVTEQWDGTNWTEVSDLNTARGLMASVGVTQTASLAVSGNFPQANTVEEWNGSSWTEIAEVNTARYNASGNGTPTQGLIFGGRIFPGSPPAAYSALTEFWNGSSWTEVADLATARGDGGNAQNISNGTSALYFSGSNPPYVYTEEFTTPITNKTITVS